MSKKKTIIANWKMNLDVAESAVLAGEILREFPGIARTSDLEVSVCPSFEAITTVREILRDSHIGVGAQDVFWQERGAYTGEISASMLKVAGVSLVIVGHSERRKYLHEDDAVVNKKLKMALAQDLTPILCVGETFEERTQDHTDLVLMRQLTQGLRDVHISADHQLIIAYEPVWVIGTGQAIDPSMAELATHTIRQTLLDLYPAHTIDDCIRIIYGGSVDENNIADFLQVPTIEGALVGSASLTAHKFIQLLKHV